MLLSLRSILRKTSTVVALFAATGVAHAQLNFEIRGSGATQIPVATANFVVNGAPPQDIPQIVRDDLARSGLFKNVDPGATALSETTPINFGEWKGRGADAVVTGSVSKLADGRFDIRFKLFDTGRQQDLGGIQLTSAPAILRLSAHRIADFVYEKLTGDKGVFSTKIAYVMKFGPQRYELQIADSDGFNPQNALVSREPIISPAWSPDGSKLAYVSFEQRKPVVYVHTVATGQRITVANFKGSNSAPAWSVDGRQLAVTLTRDGNSQIYLVNADGSNVRRFTQSGGIDTEPEFSVDGNVYFTSDRGGGPQVYRMPAGGGDAQRVTFKGDYNISPRPSPDGKALAYVSRRGGRFQVYTLDLASGQEVLLTDTAKDESPSFAPNGKVILYATDVGGRGVLAMVSSDGRVKQRITTAQGGDVREPTWGPFLP